MIYNITHLFSLWFGSDFVVIALILYAPCICAIDLRYNICARFKTCINSDISCVDIIFGHILFIGIVILMLDIKFNFLHFMAIVDYADVRVTILRIKTITTFSIIYITLGLAFSILLVVKAKGNRMKWFIYGLIFNFLAALYFFKSNKKWVQS